MVIKLTKVTSQTVKNSKVLIIINCLSLMTGKFLSERRQPFGIRKFNEG